MRSSCDPLEDHELHGLAASKVINFLEQPGQVRLRREIQNIVDSYSHPWDPLAELIQNSVDAIRLHRSRFGTDGQPNHRIDITIDRKRRAIRVADTGTGFDPEKFADLLAPGGTDKSGGYDQIGEKGVGLTYTVFVANRYELSTRSARASIAGHVDNGLLWRTGKLSDLPTFQVTSWEDEERPPSETGTTVTLVDVEVAASEHEDLFAQTPEVLQFLLRTRTAVGSLKKTLTSEGQDFDISVDLTVVKADGAEIRTTVPFDFLWPDSLLTSKDAYVLLEDFRKRAALLDDKQKAKELAGRALLKVGSEMRAGREIRYYAFFAPSRALWRDMSSKNNLVRKDDQGNDESLIEGGIFIGSRGMPTGVEIEHPSTGYAGYWPNFFMLLEDDSITFDVGRKAVPGRTKGMLREIAKELFNEIQPFSVYATKDPATTTGLIPTIQAHAKASVFEELEKLPSLGLNSIRYLKHPDGQEAAVVALFHELVAAGHLPHYFTLRTGYKETYDLWGRYRAPVEAIGANHRARFPEGVVDLPIVIEHKFKAESILSDLDKDIKFFTDMDLLVCWDLDASQFKKYSVDIEVLRPEDVLFHGSNYLLSWPGVYNLGAASQKYVLALRRFVEDLIAGSGKTQ